MIAGEKYAYLEGTMLVRGLFGVTGYPIGLRVCRHNQSKVHEPSEEDFVVFEYVADVFDAHLAFHG
jgi:hypothetical protein